MKKTKQNKRIRKGDKVYILSGNDKGETGTVLSRTEDRILVQGINIRKKHVKPSQQHQQGGIIEMEKPIHISNVQICSKEDKPVHFCAKFNKDNKKELGYMENKKFISIRTAK